MAKKKKQPITKEEAAARKEATPKNTFSVEGKKYKFLVYQYKGADTKVIKVEDALKDLAELERLVEIEAGVISLA